LNKLPINYNRFTLSLIASSQNDCNNNGEQRCSDNSDGCGGSVATMTWFNNERYFNILAFSMGVKLNSNFYKILKNTNTQAQQRLCSCYNNKNHYQFILTTTTIFVFIKIYASTRLLLFLQYLYTITYTFNVS